MSDEAPKIIKGVLSCSRISKNRLFTKEGKIGKYLKIVLIKRKEKDAYGRVAYMIKEDVTKTEHDAGVDGNFIGDAAIPLPKATTGTPAPQPTTNPPPKRKEGVPF